MSFGEEFSDVLGEIDQDPDLLPAQFTWGQGNYPCTAGAATRGGKLESGGWAEPEDLALIVRADLFDRARPERDQSITYKGRRYRIDKVGTAPDDAFLRLSCVNANRGA